MTAEPMDGAAPAAAAADRARFKVGGAYAW